MFESPWEHWKALKLKDFILGFFNAFLFCLKRKPKVRGLVFGIFVITRVANRESNTKLHFQSFCQHGNQKQNKIHLNEKRSNLDIERQKKCTIIDIKKEVGYKYAYTI